MTHTITVPWAVTCLPDFDRHIAEAAHCRSDDVHCRQDASNPLSFTLQVDCDDKSFLDVVDAVRRLRSTCT